MRSNKVKTPSASFGLLPTIDGFCVIELRTGRPLTDALDEFSARQCAADLNNAAYASASHLAQALTNLTSGLVSD